MVWTSAGKKSLDYPDFIGFICQIWRVFKTCFKDSPFLLVTGVERHLQNVQIRPLGVVSSLPGVQSSGSSPRAWGWSRSFRTSLLLSIFFSFLTFVLKLGRGNSKFETNPHRVKQSYSYVADKMDFRHNIWKKKLTKNRQRHYHQEWWKPLVFQN